MSYLAGSELPMVLINVMRGGPGLGSIGPSQSDYFQATKGHGHGDYRVPVLAPSSIAEAVALSHDAFELAERYRTPVIILADGVLGQAMEPVQPVYRMPTRTPGDWEVTGARDRPARVVRSLHLRPRPSRRTTSGCRRSSPRSPSARSAGRAKVSTTPRSSSSRTERRLVWRERRWSGLASRDCAWASSGRSASGRSHRIGCGPWRRAFAGVVVPGDVGWAAGRGRSTGSRGAHAGLLPRPDGWHGPDTRRGRQRRAPGMGADRAGRSARARRERGR